MATLLRENHSTCKEARKVSPAKYEQVNASVREASQDIGRWVPASARRGIVLALMTLTLTAVLSPLGFASTPGISGVGDDVFVAVQQEVPTFGGMYVDEASSTLYILLTDEGESLEAAQEALLTLLDEPELADYSAVAVSAQYNFTQLSTWKNQIAESAIEGLNFLDVDDQQNRVTVGVDDPESRAQSLQSTLEELGIPSDAVNIVQADGVGLDIERPSPEGSGRSTWWIALGALIGGLSISGGLLAFWRSRLARRRRALAAP